MNCHMKSVINTELYSDLPGKQNTHVLVTRKGKKFQFLQERLSVAILGLMSLLNTKLLAQDTPLLPSLSPEVSLLRPPGATPSPQKKHALRAITSSVNVCQGMA